MAICYNCEDETTNTELITHECVGTWKIILCDDCINSYENKTGHCSIDCCLSGRCDDSC